MPRIVASELLYLARNTFRSVSPDARRKLLNIQPIQAETDWILITTASAEPGYTLDGTWPEETREALFKTFDHQTLVEEWKYGGLAEGVLYCSRTIVPNQSIVLLSLSEEVLVVHSDYQGFWHITEMLREEINPEKHLFLIRRKVEEPTRYDPRMN